MVLKKSSIVKPALEKYYPCAIHEGIDDLGSLSEIIASNSNISQADCFRIVMSLTKVIGESLAMGRVVHIKTLGSFKINIHGEGADCQDNPDKDVINGAKIIYKPSSSMTKTLSQLTYKRIK